MQEPALACFMKLTTPQGLSFWTQLLGIAQGPGVERSSPGASPQEPGSQACICPSAQGTCLAWCHGSLGPYYADGCVTMMCLGQTEVRMRVK